MGPLNSINKKNINQKYSLNIKGGKEGLIVKSYNNAGDSSNTSLDNYHTKSYEDVMKSSSSIMFKNLHKNKPKAINGQMNRKILAALANKNLKEDSIKRKKPKQDVIVVEENMVDASDAYSYDTKKDSDKQKTLDSTADGADDNSEKMNHGNFQTEPNSSTKPHKQNSFVNRISEVLNNEEEKLYGSEGKMNEYNDASSKGFDSPFEYKAISPSPHLNTSAMSKEVALDDRTSRIKEEESRNDSKNESTEFPLTAAKTIIHYGKYLSEYEESEILNYMLIYYINKNVKIDESGKSKKQGKKAKKD